MNQIVADKAWLPDGWERGVRLTFSEGRIATVETGAQAGDGDIAVDAVIPGIGNAHSHAFQRALVGRAEQRAADGQDDFWSWRTQMYALAQHLDADSLRSIAKMLYLEMLRAGYTSVGEFHYFHDGGTDMARALIDAAEVTGIRLTLVPVLYERSGFDSATPLPEQSRFAASLTDFLDWHAQLMDRQSGRVRVGIGVHSLRAVSPESLTAVSQHAKECDSVMHIHIAEQQGEVDQCLAATGQRPVEWLLDHADVDENWCLVHATHLTHDEVTGIADSGAVVCLCPSTEGNLGDGLFPLADFRRAGGRIAIGSDSHVTVDPFEELRWLEYGQRLNTLKRNVGVADGSQVGADLLSAVIAGGAQAIGEPAGLVPGAPADLLVLDTQDPVLVGHHDETRLDALVFSGLRSPIARVMVGGDWPIVDGKHEAYESIVSDYRNVVSNRS